MANPNGNLVTPVGFRSDGSIHAIELDDNDRVLVNTDVEIAHYGATLISSLVNAALAAGTNTLNLPAVPVGHVHVLKSVSVNYTGVVAGVALRVSLVQGAITGALIDFTPVVSTIIYNVVVNIPLSAGMIVRLRVTGATLNDAAGITAFIEDIG